MVKEILSFSLLLLCIALVFSVIFDYMGVPPWDCVIKNGTIYSLNESGYFGSAEKGCTCDEIRAFELSKFGEVDTAALKSDFGC